MQGRRLRPAPFSAEIAGAKHAICNNFHEDPPPAESPAFLAPEKAVGRILAKYWLLGVICSDDDK
jgi:hypothetical protein